MGISRCFAAYSSLPNTLAAQSGIVCAVLLNLPPMKCATTRKPPSERFFVASRYESITLDTGTACPPRLMRTNTRPTFKFASSVEIKRTFVEYPAVLACSSSCVSTRMSSTAKERRSSRNGCCWCLNAGTSVGNASAPGLKACF